MAYNTGNTSGAVRVGNWQEELVLQEVTGIRFAPNPKDRSTQLLTQSRVIDHTDRLQTKDFVSNTRVTIQDPRKHRDYIPPSKAAPRKLLLEKQLLLQVEQETQRKLDAAETERLEPRFTTVNKSSFDKPEGFSESLVLNDPKYKVETRSKNYSVEPATTYYLHCVQKGKSSVNFPVSYINNTLNPFRKSLGFSADIRDPLVRRVETNENPKPFPKVQDFRNLMKIREKVIHNKRNIGLNEIIIAIWSNEDGETGLIECSKVIEIFADLLDVTFTNEELKCFEIALVIPVPPIKQYAGCVMDHISIIELINVIRGSLTVRQQEMIQIVFDKLDSVGKFMCV